MLSVITPALAMTTSSIPMRFWQSETQVSSQPTGRMLHIRGLGLQLHNPMLLSHGPHGPDPCATGSPGPIEPPAISPVAIFSHLNTTALKPSVLCIRRCGTILAVLKRPFFVVGFCLCVALHSLPRLYPAPASCSSRELPELPPNRLPHESCPRDSSRPPPSIPLLFRYITTVITATGSVTCRRPISSNHDLIPSDRILSYPTSLEKAFDSAHFPSRRGARGYQKRSWLGSQLVGQSASQLASSLG